MRIYEMLPDPSQELLKTIFVYENSGNLIWNISRRGFTKTGKPAGTINKGYLWLKSDLLNKQIPVHRAIWIYHNGLIPSDLVVDHIDRNPLNNKIENLRLATRSENSRNACGKRNKKSALPKNVYVDWSYKGITKYRAQVCINSKTYRVGNLDTPEIAFEEAKKLILNLFGNFLYIEQ